jgi:diaminohydroxyphosphoribosylaminopyrimidine deaminase/5-amino-6-(5-phosphoribosylamino)uracil reductase
LKNAGINVIVGVLEKECREHHKKFFTVQDKRRPYIILKWAETKDGFIAPLAKNEQRPVWISNQYSQQLVHKFRSEEHAVLVGTNTVIADNPKLNVRSWSGENPVRIVLDKNLRIEKNLSVFDESVKTIFITDKKERESIRELIFETIDFSKNIGVQVCEILYKHQIQSVIIEGGLQTLQTFINESLWDEALVFIGETEFNEGIKAPVFNKVIKEMINIKTGVLKIYTND